MRLIEVGRACRSGMGWQRKRLKDINERQRQRKDNRRKKMQKNEVDGGLAGLVGVGWQKAKGAASHHPLLSILHLSADNDM